MDWVVEKTRARTSRRVVRNTEEYSSVLARSPASGAPWKCWLVSSDRRLFKVILRIQPLKYCLEARESACFYGPLLAF
ncbi:hypothetical protein GN956_G23699 [Arapaima gigas]